MRPKPPRWLRQEPVLSEEHNKLPNQQPQPQPQPQPPASNAPQAQTPATPATPSTSAPGQTSHSAPAPQVKMEPNTNTQHLPPVNTALAASSNAHIQPTGTPTQAPASRVQTPQSAHQAPSSNVRPLSHAAAVNRANSSSNITGQAGNSSGGMANNTPSVTGMTAQPVHTHAHPQQQAQPTITSKMPIPKHCTTKQQRPHSLLPLVVVIPQADQPMVAATARVAL